MRLRHRITALCLGLALLGACGATVEENSPFGQSIAALRGGAAAVSPRFVVLLNQNAPALQVGFSETGLSGNVLLEERDGPFEYWLSPDGAQLILQDGMLHGTRGFGEGLLASELSQPLALVRGLQDGWSDRFQTYLDGNDRARTRTYRCRIDNRGAREINLFGTATNTRLMREDCRSLDQAFVNLYWVSPSGRDIVLSRQWAGPVLGMISTRVVPR